MRGLGVLLLMLGLVSVFASAQTKVYRTKSLLGTWNYKGTPTEVFTLEKLIFKEDRDAVVDVVLKMKRSGKEITKSANYFYYGNSGDLSFEMATPDEKGNKNEEIFWRYEFRYVGGGRFKLLNDKREVIDTEVLERDSSTTP